jgi:8-oxo-dGTP pyrophosphatase MutT (NUDIX family)
MHPFIEKIQARLQQPLPGINTQMKMAPPVRHVAMEVPADVRLGGVMILLVESEKQWNTFLIKRTKDGNTHSGQIAFPGGKFETKDIDIVQTALRECEEEIGVNQQLVNVLGSLTPLYIPPSNFLVTATIGYIERVQTFKPSEREVEEIIKVPLDLLFHDEIKSTQIVNKSDEKNIVMETPVYQLSEELIIWGATAMMIAEFEELVKMS